MVLGDVLVVCGCWDKYGRGGGVPLASIVSSFEHLNVMLVETHGMMIESHKFVLTHLSYSDV